MTSKEYKIILGKMFYEAENGLEIFQRADLYRERYAHSQKKDESDRLIFLAGYVAAFLEGYSNEDICFFVADMLADGYELFNFTKSDRASIRSIILQYGAEHYKNYYYPEAICKEYSHGTVGVIKKDDRMFNGWVLRAANAGSQEAQAYMGTQCNNAGRIHEAAQWWEKAADQGDVESMYNLGVYYYKHTRDYPKAGYWFEQAANNGDADAKQALNDAFYWNSQYQMWWKKS